MPLPRVYPICDTLTLRARGIDPIVFASALLSGGARILQFRHKDEWSRETVDQLERIAGLCRASGCTLIVNDRADLAAVFHSGLHVGQNDLPPTDARAVAGPDALIGFSTHNEAQLLSPEAEPADYLAFGPIFPTVSKANPDPVVGLETLRRLRPQTGKPLVAIGGITRRTAAPVLEAGAGTIAVIGDLLPEQPTPESIQARMKEWLETTR